MIHLQQFVVAQWQLVLIFVLSGVMLLWPLVQRQLSGASEIGTLRVTQLINSEKAITLDVREPKEFTDGKLPGALHIPLSQLKNRLGELEKLKERPIITYGGKGQRSNSANGILGRAGFTKLFTLAGGHKAWKDAGLPLDKN